MNPDDAAREAARWQSELMRAKFEQETNRDKALVLISGGALAVSFPFVATLTEHAAVFSLRLLISAWAGWVLALILTLVGYTLSIHVYQQAIDPLSRGEWAKAQEIPKLAKYIEPLNLATMLCAVAGFVLFAWFAIDALRDLRYEYMPLPR